MPRHLEKQVVLRCILNLNNLNIERLLRNLNRNRRVIIRAYFQ
jgi:hypothetical protein